MGVGQKRPSQEKRPGVREGGETRRKQIPAIPQAPRAPPAGSSESNQEARTSELVSCLRMKSVSCRVVFLLASGFMTLQTPGAGRAKGSFWTPTFCGLSALFDAAE